MTKKQKDMLLKQICDVLVSNGFEQDKYGNYKKEANGELYRYKFNSTSLRYETQCIHSDGSKTWVRIRSGYYKDLSITDSNKIAGMTNMRGE